MINIFFSYLLVLVSSISALYFIGYVVFHLLKIHLTEFYTDLFAKLLLGGTLFVVSTAVYFTKGVTVTVFFIPVLGTFAWLYSSKNKNQDAEVTIEKMHIFNPIIFLVGTVLVYCWRFGSIYNPAEVVPLAPHGDIIFYANCTDFLVRFGNENSSLDYLYPLGASPYHYYELWFGAGISRIFSLNTILSLVLVIFSIGNLMIWIGLCSVLSHFKKINLLDTIFCFLLLFLTGLAIHLYTNISFMQYIQVFARNSLNYSKLFALYVFSIASLLLFLKNKPLQAILCLLCLPIVSISTSIGVFPAIFLWIIIHYFVEKKLYYQALLIELTISLGFFLFYTFLTPHINTHVSTNFTDVIHKLTNSSFLKTAFNICVGTTIQFALIFAPFFLFLILNKKVKIRQLIKQPEIQILIFAYLFSLLGWSVLHDKTSSTQIFTNLSVVLLNLAATFILMICWINRNSKLRLVNLIFITSVFLIGFNNTLSEYRFEYPQKYRYIEEIISTSNKISSLGSFIFDTKDYANINFSYISNFVIQGGYLTYAKNPTFPLSLSPYSFPVSSDARLASMQKAALKNTPFWIYVEKQKEKGIVQSIPESQAQFIEEMKINYLICTKNVVLPDLLKKKVKKQIIDENTGERFLLLY